MGQRGSKPQKPIEIDTSSKENLLEIDVASSPLNLSDDVKKKLRCNAKIDYVWDAKFYPASGYFATLASNTTMSKSMEGVYNTYITNHQAVDVTIWSYNQIHDNIYEFKMIKRYFLEGAVLLLHPKAPLIF